MNLLTNGRVITRDEGGKGYYEKGAVAYEGTKIVEVGEEAALRAKYPQAEIIDAKGGVIMPAFIKLDISDLPALLGAFALGPVYGVVISFMKNLLHIVIKGTSTACVGELCNFMLGAVFSAVAGVIYKHHKSRKTAIIGAIAGAAAMAVFSVPSNYFITYPAYVQFYHMPLEAILGMYQAILPSADSLIKCLVIFNMPFTLVKGLLDAVLCMLIYKPLSPILHGRK